MDLRGKSVVILCANYIYAGTLDSITHDLVWLRDPAIVYETGEWSAKAWKDAQRLPVPLLRIERSAIESMGEVVRG